MFNFSEQLNEPIEPAVYNLLRSSDTVEVFSSLQPTQVINFYKQSVDEAQMQSRLKPVTD